MPRPQYLDAVPGFGERLIDQFQRTAGDVGQAYQKKRANDTLYSMLQSSGGQTQNGILSPMQSIAIQQAATNALGEKGASDLISSLSQQSRASQRHDESVHKATSKYTEGVIAQKEAADLDNAHLTRLEQLNKKDLAKPAIASLAEKLDIPISILSNPDSEEFQKVSQDLVSNIKDVFGSRITQYEVQNYLKTIPTLMNSKEGRDRVIKSKRIFNKAKEIIYNNYKKVRKEKGLGYDIHEQVAEEAGPQIQKLADEFLDLSGQSRGVSEGVRMISPQGKEVTIPSDMVQQAEAAGGRRIA